MSEFGLRLLRERQRRHLSLRQLSVLSGVDKAWISRLERGERDNISLLRAVQLADALRLSLDYLSGRDRRLFK